MIAAFSGDSDLGLVERKGRAELLACYSWEEIVKSELKGDLLPDLGRQEMRRWSHTPGKT
jgi:hypothetical protein